MARSVAQRYLVAAFAFMAAGAWLGVGLQSGFECLLVFVLALQAVRLYQGRRNSRGRSHQPRRGRSNLNEPGAAEARHTSPSAPSESDRPHHAGRVYDGDRHDSGWPMASEASW